MVTRAFGRLRISVNPRLASATERNPVVKNGGGVGTSTHLSRF